MSQPATRSPASWFPDVAGLAVAITACFGVAGLGGAATARNLAPWYDSLIKPSWNPPNGVFGPVWSLLYLLMAVASWLVWRERKRVPSLVARALAWFAVQLALNALWSWLFFEWHRINLALVEMCFLWLAIVATSFGFRRVSPIAAILLLPYLLWVTYALTLNAGVAWLN